MELPMSPNIAPATKMPLFFFPSLLFSLAVLTFPFLIFHFLIFQFFPYFSDLWLYYIYHLISFFPSLFLSLFFLTFLQSLFFTMFASLPFKSLLSIFFLMFLFLFFPSLSFLLLSLTFLNFPFLLIPFLFFVPWLSDPSIVWFFVDWKFPNKHLEPSFDHESMHFWVLRRSLSGDCATKVPEQSYGTGGMVMLTNSAENCHCFAAIYCDLLYQTISQKRRTYLTGHRKLGTFNGVGVLSCILFPSSLSLSYASFTFFMVDAVVWLKLCCERSFQPVLQGPQHGRPPSGKGKGKGGKGGKGSFSESHGGKGTKREAATATTKDSLTSLSKFIAWAKQIHLKDTVVIQYLWYESCCECAQKRSSPVKSFFCVFFCDPTRSGLLYVMLWGDLCWEKNLMTH